MQAGFSLIGKREMKGGFGVANCEAQRHLLGDDWESEAVNPEAWSVPDGGADLVLGNPPCSGFSVLSTKGFRGADSKINSCMWAFVEYAARARPTIAIFESVPQAYRQGGSLMTALLERLNERTGLKYSLTHVLHNAYSLGGAAIRPRYFWVASQVPFGVEVPDVSFYPTLRDVIGDLAPLDHQWEDQPYRELASPWAPTSSDGLVDGHIGLDNPLTRRIADIMAGLEWKPREHAQQVIRRYYEVYGELPKSWYNTEKLVRNDFFMGFNTPVRWPADEPARVITGAGLQLPIHPWQNRMLTHREVARIMGFPDDWLIEPLKSVSGLSMTWGKGITVQCGKWISEWAKRSIEGNPGGLSSKNVGENESLVDVTHAWKHICDTVVNKQVSSRRETIMTEVAEGAAPRAGRPRPTATIERDERVFVALETPQTKEQLAASLEIEPKQVYLSLFRLRRADRVKRDRVEGKITWSRVS